jgi:hypothetical protein
MQNEKDLSKILRRVQQFINMAEGSNNNPPDSAEWHALDVEQQNARNMADALMLEYAITEAMAEAAKPATERMKPIMEMFEGGTDDLSSYIDRLSTLIAEFARCKIRRYGHRDDERRVWMHKVFGYESDVRYFLFLYTTLRLHFIGALRPQIDKELSLDENCYILHNAGFGWREIAKMYGWTTRYEDGFGILSDYQEMGTEVWFSPEGVRWEGESRIAVRPYRSAYFRECKKRKEEPIKNITPESFRSAAAEGYLSRIRHRLREVQEKRKLEGGSALVLRMEDVEQFIRDSMGTCTKCPACGLLSVLDYQCDLCGNTEGMPGTPPAPLQECPRCKAAKSGQCREHTYSWGRSYTRKFSEAGYAAGKRQADSADLGGQRTESARAKEIK